SKKNSRSSTSQSYICADTTVNSRPSYSKVTGSILPPPPQKPVAWSSCTALTSKSIGSPSSSPPPSWNSKSSKVMATGYSSSTSGSQPPTSAAPTRINHGA